MRISSKIPQADDSANLQSDQFQAGDRVKGVIDGQSYTGVIEQRPARRVTTTKCSNLAVMFDQQVIVYGDFADGCYLWYSDGNDLYLSAGTIEPADNAASADVTGARDGGGSHE